MKNTKAVLEHAIDFAELKLDPRQDALLICRIKPHCSVVSALVHGIIKASEDEGYAVSAQTIFRQSSALAHAVLSNCTYRPPAESLRLYLGSLDSAPVV